MRSNLKRGRFVPPRSLGAALVRQRELSAEITRIQRQVADPGRMALYPNAAAYDAWRGRAGRALGLFEVEEKRLTQWVDDRRCDAESLLSEAYEVLWTMRDEVDFEPHEAELVQRLGSFLGALAPVSTARKSV